MFSMGSEPFAPVGVSDCDCEERDGDDGEDKVKHFVSVVAGLGDFEQ
jgi:hypothetical protein